MVNGQENAPEDEAQRHSLTGLIFLQYAASLLVQGHIPHRLIARTQNVRDWSVLAGTYFGAASFQADDLGRPV
jgi:hypothetical protein